MFTVYQPSPTPTLPTNKGSKELLSGPCVGGGGIDFSTAISDPRSWPVEEDTLRCGRPPEKHSRSATSTGHFAELRTPEL